MILWIEQTFQVTGRAICWYGTQGGADSQQVNMCPYHGAPVESIRGRLNSLQHIPLLTSKRRLKLASFSCFCLLRWQDLVQVKTDQRSFFYSGCVDDKSGVILALWLCDAREEQWWIVVFVTSSLPRRIRKIRLHFCNPNNSQSVHEAEGKARKEVTSRGSLQDPTHQVGGNSLEILRWVGVVSTQLPGCVFKGSVWG